MKVISHRPSYFMMVIWPYDAKTFRGNDCLDAQMFHTGKKHKGTAGNPQTNVR